MVGERREGGGRVSSGEGEGAAALRAVHGDAVVGMGVSGCGVAERQRFDTGSRDGVYRIADASTGTERWEFREHVQL